MLKIGIKGKQQIQVGIHQTAKEMGSGTLEVFATPAMVALMEQTAWQSVAKELEHGWGTVGTSLEVTHEAPTPLGMTVTCESELLQVDGRKLTFSIQARDEVGVIGNATHERFMVNDEKFQKKADEKAQNKK